MIPSNATPYSFASVSLAARVRVTFVASFASTLMSVTATVAFVSIPVTTKSAFLRFLVLPFTIATTLFASVGVTESKITFFTSTSLVVSAESLPTVILAVIVALPALTPVTVPSAATVAIESSLDV